MAFASKQFAIVASALSLASCGDDGPRRDAVGRDRPPSSYGEDIGTCTRRTLRDDAYAFTVRVVDETGYFKVNVGTGPTHGGCPDYRVNHIGERRVIAGDASAFETLRTEACFLLADAGSATNSTTEWDVVVPFVPETGLDFDVAPGANGTLTLELRSFDGTVAGTHTFTERDSWHVDRASLPAPGGLASRIPEKPFLEPKRGVYYFPWYGAPDGPTGNYVHWNPSMPTLYTPELGLYDSADPAVIDQHMAWIAAAHMNLVVVSYWDAESSNENLPTILDGAAPHGLEVSAMIETATRGSGSPRENLLAQLQAILAGPATKPNWLRAEGVPIVFVYGRVEGQLDGFADFEWVKDQLGTEVIVMYPVDRETTPDRIAAMGGGFVFAANSGGASTWTGAHEEDWQWTWTATQGGGLSALPILPSFEEVRTVDQGDNYLDQWRAARDAMPDMILVNSWNEYHESTIIEPTEEFGMVYLDLTANAAELACHGELGALSPAE